MEMGSCLCVLLFFFVLVQIGVWFMVSCAHSREPESEKNQNDALPDGESTFERYQAFSPCCVSSPLDLAKNRTTGLPLRP